MNRLLELNKSFRKLIFEAYIEDKLIKLFRYWQCRKTFACTPAKVDRILNCSVDFCSQFLLFIISSGLIHYHIAKSWPEIEFINTVESLLSEQPKSHVLFTTSSLAGGHEAHVKVMLLSREFDCGTFKLLDFRNEGG